MCVNVFPVQNTVVFGFTRLKKKRQIHIVPYTNSNVVLIIYNLKTKSKLIKSNCTLN